MADVPGEETSFLVRLVIVLTAGALGIAFGDHKDPGWSPKVEIYRAPGRADTVSDCDKFFGSYRLLELSRFTSRRLMPNCMFGPPRYLKL